MKKRVICIILCLLMLPFHSLVAAKDNILPIDYNAALQTGEQVLLPEPADPVVVIPEASGNISTEKTEIINRASMLMSAPLNMSEQIAQIKRDQKSAIYNIDLNAPFSKEARGVGETVNIETGDLILQKNLVKIPGFAGHDLDLVLAYNSARAGVFEESVLEGQNGQLTNTTEARTGSLGGFHMPLA